MNLSLAGSYRFLQIKLLYGSIHHLKSLLLTKAISDVLAQLMIPHQTTIAYRITAITFWL